MIPNRFFAAPPLSVFLRSEVLMKKRIVAFLLALCLCLGLIPAVSAAGPALEDCVDVRLLVTHACQMFSTLEGQYDSVTPKDSNACSIGFMQWHGEGARTLLKMISSVDPVYAEEVLGTEFFTEINVGTESWKNRCLNSSEAAKVKTLISSDIGRQCQDDYASGTIISEAKTGWKRGVRTEPALLYYVSIENQFGIGGANNCMRYLRETTGMSASDTFDSLEYFHNAWLAAAATGNYPNTISKYLNARKKVYNFIVNTLQLPSGLDTGSTPFTDLPQAGHWAREAIEWAYNHNPQITSGTSATTFSPFTTLTRGEAMTFLWAAAGKPSPTSSNNPFKDVSSEKYYYTAILWAVENGITAGKAPDRFAPADPVNRAEMITFLWAFAGKPAPSSSANPFSDVSSSKYYYTPVLWANGAGIFVGNEGDGNSKLQPKHACNRAYVVTYLYRYFTR